MRKYASGIMRLRSGARPRLRIQREKCTVDLARSLDITEVYLEIKLPRIREGH